MGANITVVEKTTPSRDNGYLKAAAKHYEVISSFDPNSNDPLRPESLKDMVDRMDVPDVSSFIAAVLQADQLGVGIGKVLRIQSEQMRIKRRQRAQEKAQQAPVKMLFPMVFLIFPSIFVVLLGPAAFQFMESDGLG